MVLKIDTLISLALFTVYESNAIDGQPGVTPSDVAEKMGNGVKASFVRIAFDQLDEDSFIERVNNQRYADGYRVTANGARVVEAELRKEDNAVSIYVHSGWDALTEHFVSTKGVPAADRFVSKNDNAPAHEQAIELLDELEQSLRKGNEAGDIFGEDKEAIADEVSTLKKLLDSAKVRAVFVIDFAKRSLGWISEKAGGAAIGDLAKRGLAHLIEWLG